VKKKTIILGSITLGIIFCFLAVTNAITLLGYTGKEKADKYRSMIWSELEGDFPTFYLPDEYHFFGRYHLNNLEEGLVLVNDRMVYKRVFEHNGESYYFYYSGAIESHKVTYPDIYNQNDEKVAKMYENPEGYFIEENYLYYAYGKEHRIKHLSLHHFRFYHIWYKDYQYARLNLDTMTNEKISQDDYYEKHVWRNNYN
jgi:hypothetical protein